ncbi:hypothetical protein ACFV06_01010 [Streptomyces sp. NPDC059618]|uniref:hypothetical protein n=1 Tax=Streptomyces sp. NPDC059618 TaxID=3346887 RepID=UPI0036AFC155
MFPTDPANPPLFGARMDGATIVVKIPLCDTDDIRRVEVVDFDDVKPANPPVLWWASGATTVSAKAGFVRLWSGEGFKRHKAPLAKSAVPRNLDVSYLNPSGDGRDDVLPLRSISKADLRAGQYWTSDGQRTARQIDAQLHCKKSK